MYSEAVGRVRIGTSACIGVPQLIHKFQISSVSSRTIFCLIYISKTYISCLKSQRRNNEISFNIVLFVFVTEIIQIMSYVLSVLLITIIQNNFTSSVELSSLSFSLMKLNNAINYKFNVDLNTEFD